MNGTANEVYKGICGYLSGKGGDYTCDDGSGTVTLKLECGGVVCPTFIEVDESAERVSLIAVLPISVTDSNRETLLRCVTEIHRELVKGTFCVYPDEGRLTYESTDIFAGLTGIGEEFIESILKWAAGALNSYAAVLVAAAEGKSE